MGALSRAERGRRAATAAAEVGENETTGSD
jgi:hypothetical protein